MICARASSEPRRPGGTRRNIGRRGFLGLALLTLASGCARPYPAAGLRPLPLIMIGGWAGPRITPETDSLQPTLRWETFPRPEDLKVDTAGRLGDAQNVTYELRIWRAEAEGLHVAFPAELVYARTGLTEPGHTVETPLAPDTLYLWTIRAHFDRDGQPRVTEWGVLGAYSRVTTIPPRSYYRFKTPKTSRLTSPLSLRLGVKMGSTSNLEAFDLGDCV